MWRRWGHATCDSPVRWPTAGSAMRSFPKPPKCFWVRCAKARSAPDAHWRTSISLHRSPSRFTMTKPRPRPRHAGTPTGMRSPSARWVRAVAISTTTRSPGWATVKKSASSPSYGRVGNVRRPAKRCRSTSAASRILLVHLTVLPSAWASTGPEGLQRCWPNWRATTRTSWRRSNGYSTSSPTDRARGGASLKPVDSCVLRSPPSASRLAARPRRALRAKMASGSRHSQTAEVVGHIDCVLFERIQRHHVEGALVAGGQHHRSGTASLIGPKPVGRGDAPTVTRHQARELELGSRRRQVVSDRALMLEELGGHDGTDGVAADILGPRRAAAVAVEACHLFGAARIQRATQHVVFGHSAASRSSTT